MIEKGELFELIKADKLIKCVVLNHIYRQAKSMHRTPHKDGSGTSGGVGGHGGTTTAGPSLCLKKQIYKPNQKTMSMYSIHSKFTYCKYSS